MSTHEALEMIERGLGALPSAAARNAASAELAGEPAPYAEIQARLGHLIGEAKLTHAALGALGSHRHEWNEDDYCNRCGADGRS